MSTAYYALFHCLATCCADMLVGGPNSNRSEGAWVQAYRALRHGDARSRCKNVFVRRFPTEIQQFADHFVAMQEQRHAADYNPAEKFSKSSVTLDITATSNIIDNFTKAAAKDQRAFAVYVLLPLRQS